MAHETLAHWAELVPNIGSVKVKQMLAPPAFSYPVADLFL